MINNVVKYSIEEGQLIRAFDEKENKSTNDWKNKEFKGLKDNVKKHYKVEQNYICPYCQVEYPIKHGMVWDIEHIISRDSKVQFMFEPYNLCVACKDCNGAKSSINVLKNEAVIRFPRRSNSYKIVHPHFDIYNKHINAVLPGDFYRPLSEKGEFTIITCRLLRFYGVVQKEQPDIEINDLAKAMIGAEGAARRVLEDEIVRRIKEKRDNE